MIITVKNIKKGKKGENWQRCHFRHTSRDILSDKMALEFSTVVHICKPSYLQS